MAESRLTRWLSIGALAFLPGLTGCGGNALTRWRMANDDSLSPAPKREEAADDRNFFARMINPAGGLLTPAQPSSISGMLAAHKNGPSLAPPPPDPAAGPTKSHGVSRGPPLESASPAATGGSDPRRLQEGDSCNVVRS
jgi:hypothetical protein